MLLFPLGNSSSVPIGRFFGTKQMLPFPLGTSSSVLVGRVFVPIKCFSFLWAIQAVFLLVDFLGFSFLWAIQAVVELVDFFGQSNASLSSVGNSRGFSFHPPSASLLVTLALSFSCSYRCAFFLGGVG